MKQPIRRTAFFVGVFLALIILMGCATDTGTARIVPSLDEWTEERLRLGMEEGRFREVLLMIDRLGRENSKVPHLEAIRQEALSQIQASYKEALSREDWAEAYSLAISLESLGLIEPGRFRAGILAKRAKTDAESDRAVPALFRYRQAVQQGWRERQELQALIAYADEQGQYAVGDYLHETLRQAWAAGEAGGGDESTPRARRENPRPETMLKGAATVWVNRGMTIQQGVGIPDRVVGSGFFVDRRGYLVTNYHVIQSEVDPEYEGYSRLYVRMPGAEEEKIPARVVGWDEILDLALLKVEVEPEFVFSITRPEAYRVGDRIYALGSPGGLPSTFTSGIVSAVDRRILPIGEMIQVDVPINQGNSGGPLINERGEVIGVVFAGIEQFEGVNFAIPSVWLLSMLPDLYQDGAYQHTWLGTAVHSTDEGLEVLYTFPESPAEMMGLRAGDILREINGEAVTEISAAQVLLSPLPEKAIITVKWEREGSQESGLALLGERPISPIEEALDKDLKENLVPVLFGMNLEKTEKGFLSREYYVKEVFQGMVADETGLSENDPLAILRWEIDEENRIILMQIRVKKRKAGFLESAVQLGNYMDLNNII